MSDKRTSKQNTSVAGIKLKGPRFVIDSKSSDYPEQLRELECPPKTLYVVGNPVCLQKSISIVGARKATPYGKTCAEHFASLAAKMNITVVSGGAYGCDSAAHTGALQNSGVSVAVLGGGCNKIYPARNKDLFQQLIDGGGALVSEHEWDFDPLPYTFRLRNRIIAALSKATLIVEAGMPSGTFSTADDALSLGREVMVVPGAITAPNSKGSNHLLFQGAVPIIDDSSFMQLISSLYDTPSAYVANTTSRVANNSYSGRTSASACISSHNDPSQKRIQARTQPKTKALTQPQAGMQNIVKQQSQTQAQTKLPSPLFDDPLICALLTEPLSQEEIYSLALRYCKNENPSAWAAVRVQEAQDAGLISCYADGSYGPLR